ncbi:FUSC family protein [Marinobacterium mangrovicola]|uniref:Putative membrane protein YccC n=1 Tax=Marinobacterium mangrovicola TaxID=1476959 RepID=A0A4R1GNB6_9GAMM|nr:FUSC family protein [Marinobacterium mangrovicola]TCK08700.1 putative membrane protein YccC [Marinobacterium mangrovicola]
MTLTESLSRLGFDTGRLAFVLRTAIAVALSVLIAWAVGLDHPHWAGMAVWAASLPVRGQLVAKSLARLGGTILGAIVGVAIVWFCKESIILLALALSLWVSACVLVGHVVRSFLTYGAILAGYSASLVALVDIPHHDQIIALGFDRMATALIGVVLAIGVSWFFAARSAAQDDMAQIVDFSAGVMRHVRAVLRGDSEALLEKRHSLISRMAALDAALEMRGVDTGLSREKLRQCRRVLPELLSVLLWRRQGMEKVLGEPIQQALDELISTLEKRQPSADIPRQFDELLAAIKPVPELARLHTFMLALHKELTPLMRDEGDDTLSPQLVLHRDWIGARQASIRAFTLMMSVGFIWAWSGESYGAYMLLGVSVMSTVFSTFDSPARVMRWVFVGQLMGAIAALVCHWVVWPYATSELQQVLMMWPFIGLGVLVMSHRRLGGAGFDYNMVFLLLSAPGLPLQGSLENSVILSLAVVVAPLIAWAGYLLIYPVNAGRRIEDLKRQMLGELQNLAASQESPSTRKLWRARTFHRLFHLVRWSDMLGNQRFRAAEWGTLLLRLEMATLALHTLRNEAQLAATDERAVDYALSCFDQLQESPGELKLALEDVLLRIGSSIQAPMREPLQLAAEALSEQPAFFKGAVKNG